MRRTTTRLIFLSLLIASVTQSLSTNPSSEGVEVRFVDVTQASGLRFLHRNSATLYKYLIETMTGGVAVFDYDNDGWLDVFFVNGAKLKDPQPDSEILDKSDPQFWNRLFKNNHDGTFTDVTEKAGLQGRGYGMGVAVGDYDNDGYEDLFVTNYGECVLYHNNGDGTFTDVTARSKIKTDDWATSAAFLDYDNDGYLDLFVSRYMHWNFKLGSLFCGENIPGGRAYCHPDEFESISNYLFHNNGDGTFTDVSEASHVKASKGKGLGVSIADYNNDGSMDIYVANDAQPQFLFKNNGDDTFTEVGVMAGVGYSEMGNTFAGMGTDFADFDNDGYPDIVTTALPYQFFSFFHNNRDGTFSYESLTSNLGEITRLFSGWGIRIFDYDNDGSKDLFVAASHVMDNIEVTQPHLRYMQKPLLLKHVGKTFVDVSGTSGDIFNRAYASRGAAFGDLDNDGDVDIVVSNCNGEAYLARNEGGNNNHWIVLDLRGTKSNRDGIGAKVVLTSRSGNMQYNMASTTASYLSANDRRIFFGIGREESIKQIRIQWPSGIEQVISEPKPDQFLKVQEPEPASAGRVLPTKPSVVYSKLPQPPATVKESPTGQSLKYTSEQAAKDQYRLGQSLLKDGKTAEAADAFEKAVALNPESPEARLALGISLARQGREKYGAAMEQFLRILQVNPNHVDARINISHLLELEGNATAAVTYLQETVALVPQNADAYLMLGQKQYMLQRYPDAVQSFQRGLELDPQLNGAHYHLGLALLGTGDNDAAIREFEAALGQDPRNANAHYQLGKLQLQLQELSKAAPHLEAAIRLKPAMAEAYAELGRLYEQQQKLEEAEKAFQSAIRSKPDLVKALNGLAALLTSLGRSEEAKPYLERVRRLTEQRMNTRLAYSSNSQGLNLLKEGRLVEALKAFADALTKDPSYAAAAYNQGLVLARQNRLEEAAQAFRTAVRLRPGFALAHFGLGLVLKAREDPSAEEEFQKARLLSKLVPQGTGDQVTRVTKSPD
jgi:tetratricopeptide (TPR) repeat protein